MNSTAPPAYSPPGLTCLFWQDVYVVVINNESQASEYAKLATDVLARSQRYPGGIGFLTIIPPDTKPPSDAVRIAVNKAMQRAEASLRCLCWFVEGDGFQGAMVRAILTGLRIFGKHGYPTHVSSSLQQSLAWILPHLGGGTSRLADVTLAANVIMTERLVGRAATGDA